MTFFTHPVVNGDVNAKETPSRFKKLTRTKNGLFDSWIVDRSSRSDKDCDVEDGSITRIINPFGRPFTHVCF